MELIASVRISFTNLVTLRAGEPVYDNVASGKKLLDREIVKIKSLPGSAECIFYDSVSGGCANYQNRPMQCRVLKCWEPEDLENIYLKDRMDRIALLDGRPGITKLIGDHEEKCSYGTVLELLLALRKDGRVLPEVENRLAEMLEYDEYRRYMVMGRMNVPETELDFYFGTPFAVVVRRFGFDVVLTGEDESRIVFGGIFPVFLPE